MRPLEDKNFRDLLPSGAIYYYIFKGASDFSPAAQVECMVIPNLWGQVFPQGNVGTLHSGQSEICPNLVRCT